MKLAFYNCLFLSTLFIHNVGASSSLDSLGYYSIEELETYFEKETNNNDVQFEIALEYLSRVKKNPDSLKFAKAYAYLSESKSRTKESLEYADLSIQYSKNVDDKDFPAKAYYRKCAELYYAGKYNECFDTLLLAKSSAEKQNSDIWKLKTSRLIAIFMETVGELESAHEMFLDNFEIFQRNKALKDENPFTYINNIFFIANSYIRLDSFNKAKIFIEQGMSIATKTNQEDYGRFLNLLSLIKIEQNHFEEAIDSLLEAKLYLNEFGPSFICGNYILASAFLGLKNDKQARYYVDLNVNKMHKRNNSILSYKQNAYADFIDFYREKNDVENELKYVLKKNTVDSILVKGQIVIANANKIIEKIELLDSKSLSINELQRQNKDYKKNGIVFAFLCLFSISGLAYYVKRSNEYKNKFESLMLQNQLAEFNVSSESISKKNNLTTDIHEDIITHILSSLNMFEESKKYTNNSYTLDSLAKEFNTNKSYLSKVINEHKQMNFSNYINDLRIGHIIEELKADNKLRSYTIKAIAQESGFNTSQSFSKAFHKRTGIYPSYFIKMINAKNLQE